MEQQILDSPSDVEKKFNYAGFWIRFGAALIDGVILSIVNAAITFALFGGISVASSPGAGTGSLLLSFSITMALYISYFCGFESSSKQATPGKMAVGIKVGNYNGEQISFMNALGRYLAKFISGIILLIGYMMAGWDEKKQALHDKLASTYVYEA
jgi:uncharacterized RDD family membrane protein YckC